MFFPGNEALAARGIPYSVAGCAARGTPSDVALPPYPKISQEITEKNANPRKKTRDK